MPGLATAPHDAGTASAARSSNAAEESARRRISSRINEEACVESCLEAGAVRWPTDGENTEGPGASETVSDTQHDDRLQVGAEVLSLLIRQEQGRATPERAEGGRPDSTSPCCGEDFTEVTCIPIRL